MSSCVSADLYFCRIRRSICMQLYIANIHNFIANHDDAIWLNIHALASLHKAIDGGGGGGLWTLV